MGNLRSRSWHKMPGLIVLKGYGETWWYAIAHRQLLNKELGWQVHSTCGSRELHSLMTLVNPTSRQPCSTRRGRHASGFEAGRILGSWAHPEVCQKTCCKTQRGGVWMWVGVWSEKVDRDCNVFSNMIWGVVSCFTRMSHSGWQSHKRHLRSSSQSSQSSIALRFFSICF